MKTIPTRVYKLNAAAYLSKTKRRALNEGGTTSSKTHSILSLLIFIAQCATRPLIISIVSESLPHLRRGCIRDFVRILGDDYDENKFNKSEHIYNFGNAIIEFFPADDPTKMRGGRRDILYINECNNVHYDAYRELDIRTSRFTFLDWNPTSEFWAHTEGLTTDPLTEFIHSTYLDVKAVLHFFDTIQRDIIQNVIDNIESNKDKDPNWWRVYGLGLVGKIDGLIHPNFTTVKQWPEHGNLTGYGLDFGFNDPCVLVRCKILNEFLVCDEVIAETGMTNSDLSTRMEKAGLKKGRDEIIADCAEPKSIEELHRMGWNIRPAIKGPDSVVAGIQKVNQFKQVWTERSTTAVKEQRNYMWARDKNGKILDTPASNGFDHCFIAGTMVETNKGKVAIEKISIGDMILTSKGYKKVIKSGPTGIKETFSYTFCGKTLVSTNSHLIYTVNNGFSPINRLTQDDICCILDNKGENICTLNFVNLMGEHIEDTRRASAEMIGFILKTILNIFMSKSTSFLMEIYLKAMWFTMSMKTRSIIQSKIYVLKKKNSILKTILQQINICEAMTTLNIFNAYVPLLHNGILRKMELSYINTLDTLQQAAWLWLKGCVFVVVKNIKQKAITKALRNFAQTTANQNIVEKIKWTILNVFVFFAEKLLKSINTTSNYPAQNCVLPEGEQVVYNLEIDSCHEFFANDILVHNCMDARRYWVASKTLGPKPGQALRAAI